jgi:hypothetical protein
MINNDHITNSNIKKFVLIQSNKKQDSFSLYIKLFGFGKGYCKRGNHCNTDCSTEL